MIPSWETPPPALDRLDQWQAQRRMQSHNRSVQKAGRRVRQLQRYPDLCLTQIQNRVDGEVNVVDHGKRSRIDRDIGPDLALKTIRVAEVGPGAQVEVLHLCRHQDQDPEVRRWVGGWWVFKGGRRRSDLP